MVYNLPGSGPLADQIRADAYTRTLTISGALNPGTQNTLTIEVRDDRDAFLDSGILIKEGSFKTFAGPLIETSNTPPEISAPECDILVPENTTAVTKVTATDPDGQTLTYGIVGGRIRRRSISIRVTGVIRFKNAPDFENPTDDNGDNVYDVLVKVTDSGSPRESALQDYHVRVQDIAVENGAPDCPIVTREGTQDGSAPIDDVLTGPAYHNTFFVAEEGASGHDRITNFGKDDVFATSKALYDSNGDGIITFGANKVLDLDGPDAGIDTVSFDGLDARKGLQFLGEGCEDVFVYATATVRPKGALEGKLGDDALAGDNPDAKATKFFFDTALDLNLGHDKITNFGAKDILVTTTKLFDSNNDDRIDFGSNHLLDLSGGLGGPGDPGLPGEVGNLDIKDTAGHAVTKLEFDGQVDHGGVHYYVYSTVNSAAGIDDLLFA